MAARPEKPYRAAVLFPWTGPMTDDEPHIRFETREDLLYLQADAAEIGGSTGPFAISP